MVRLYLVVATFPGVFAARIAQEGNELGKEGTEDIVEYLLAKGESEEDAHRVANVVDEWWPLDEVQQGDRNMKASHMLESEARLAFFRAYNKSQSEPSGANLLLQEEEEEEEQTTDTCAELDALECAGDVGWAFKEGKMQKWAGEAYYDLPKYTSRSLLTANISDFQKMFYCSEAIEKKCSAPPCECSQPPCNICDERRYVPKEQCHAHAYCVGMEGACCPQPDGTDHTCCSYRPKITYGAATYEYRQIVPGEVLSKALGNGAYLGPLQATRCAGQSLSSSQGPLQRCADACTHNDRCEAFSWQDENCALYARGCNPVYEAGDAMVFVKNRQQMTPHFLPPMTVSEREAGNHFLVIGDWGSESCPGRDSLHYVMKREKGSEKWNIDHEAQWNVAKVMADVGQRVKPFVVVNAGDNFYWGGVNHRDLGGKDVHDHQTFQKAFEQVYKDRSLMVPWLNVMGNHDYGGDGCMANVRAQFDYTILDMLKNNRWKMPSPYYNHRVDFSEGYSAEFFMLDTNIEDAFMGRHGGICKQQLCWETRGAATVPYDQCKAWFNKLWSEQTEWFQGVIPRSTADWKIVVTHHKPHGKVAKVITPLIVEHGVQLMIGSHTHEMAFFDKWYTAKKPLLVVGAGGGAQANPGCGRGLYCSKPHQYGMADVDIQEKQLVVTIYLHDGEEVFKTNICKDGSVQDGPCS